MRKAVHKLLGKCFYTDACQKLQENNADPHTIFMEINGQVEKVTRCLVKMSPGQVKGGKRTLKNPEDLLVPFSLGLTRSDIALFDRLRGRKSRSKYIAKLLHKDAKERSIV